MEKGENDMNYINISLQNALSHNRHLALNVLTAGADKITWQLKTGIVTHYHRSDQLALEKA